MSQADKSVVSTTRGNKPHAREERRPLCKRSVSNSSCQKRSREQPLFSVLTLEFSRAPQSNKGVTVCGKFVACPSQFSREIYGSPAQERQFDRFTCSFSVKRSDISNGVFGLRNACKFNFLPEDQKKRMSSRLESSSGTYTKTNKGSNIFTAPLPL